MFISDLASVNQAVDRTWQFDASRLDPQHDDTRSQRDSSLVSQVDKTWWSSANHGRKSSRGSSYDCGESYSWLVSQAIFFDIRNITQSTVRQIRANFKYTKKIARDSPFQYFKAFPCTALLLLLRYFHGWPDSILSPALWSCSKERNERAI